MSKFKFKPRKLSSERTNGAKAKEAEERLYPNIIDLGLETRILDLITDFGHLCDREGVDFNRVLSIAHTIWEEGR